MITLFDSESEAGVSESFVTRGTIISVQAIGTFDGATVELHASIDGTNSTVDANLSFDEPGMQTVIVASGVTMWAELTSPGSSTSVSCLLVGT